MLQTAGQDFWRRLPDRTHRLHEYFVQYLRVHDLITNLSYHALRGWRTLHHLGQLAAAQADAEFFGTKLADHAAAYVHLRRDVQAAHLPPRAAAVATTATGPRVITRTHTTRYPDYPAPVSTIPTKHEMTQIKRAFHNAEKGNPIRPSELPGTAPSQRRRSTRRTKAPHAVTNST
jgi:hypothetical protein